MTLQELNREYFGLYGELYNARTLLPHKQYKATVEALQKAYADDLERVLLTKELSIGRERFELRFQVHNWLPRRRFVLWWNKVAKALTRRYTAELTAELQRLETEAQKAESVLEPSQIQKEATNAESVVETIKGE